MAGPAADVLAGRKTVGTISGQILFAGQHASRTFLRRYTGYVEQFGEPTPSPLCPPWGCKGCIDSSTGQGRALA